MSVTIIPQTGDFLPEVPEGKMNIHIYCPEMILIKPKQYVRVMLEFKVQLEKGFYAKMEDGPTLFFKFGVSVLGGIIEHSFEGEWSVDLFNGSTETAVIRCGEVIAQCLILRHVCASLVVIEKEILSSTIPEVDKE